MNIKFKKLIYHIAGIPMLLAYVIISLPSLAQEGSQGNTAIFASGQMTFFANHNFITGGAGILPGVILTERNTATISYLNFSGAGLSSTGASDAGYVDGYVRKYGTGQFIFPVGDNGNAGQFAASADGTSGAYYHADPSVAVTSNLFTSSNYTALPSGGPFARTSKAATLESIDAVEYWDIDGATATPVTLTWDAGSNVSTLTASTLYKLSIVGWNTSTLQWEPIASTVDVTSVLGGTSSLTSGSITTNAAVIPNNYLAYTLAALTSAALPVKLMEFQAKKEGKAAQLTWSTTEETNSDRFEIQHSLNGRDWSRIGTVKSTGESVIVRNYAYTDIAPAAGDNLYRVKMIDNDATFAYSSIRVVTFSDLKDAAAFVYPNPSSDRIFLSNHISTYVTQIRIIDMNGRQVLSSSSIADGVNVKGLSADTYLMVATNKDGSSFSQKILISH